MLGHDRRGGRARTAVPARPPTSGASTPSGHPLSPLAAPMSTGLPPAGRCWHFAASTAAISEARNTVAAAVEQVHPELVDDARLLVSELATNAVTHAASEFAITTVVGAHTVRVEVEDHSAELPTMRDPQPHATSGRGFHIIAALASRWGVIPSSTGKVVWVELST